MKKDYRASKVIESNIKLLKEEENTKLYQLDYKVALNKFKNDGMKFDIIFLDPPYRLNIIAEIIDFIIENKLINDKGIMVCQYVRGNYIPKEENNIKTIKNYTYASSEICIYQFVSEEKENE